MKKKLILILIVMAAIMILSVITLTKPTEILSGNEAYYHIAAAKSEGHFVLSQYDYLLKIAFLFFEPVLFMKIFPIILGALCVFLFYFITENFLSGKSAIYSTAIFMLSPAFLYVFSTNSAEIVPIFLLFSGILLLIQKNKALSYLSIVLFVLSSLSSIFVGALVILIFVTHFLIKREKRYDFFVGSALIILNAILRKPFFMIYYSVSNLSLLSSLFSDLGGKVGISIFTAIFFVAGIFATRKRRYFYPVIIYLIISFLINQQTIIYGNVLICAFAGVGFKTIIEKKWKLSDLKQTMNFFLIGGILFSAISHISMIKNSGPSIELVEAAKWIGQNSDENAIILSAPSNSFIIKYYGRSPFISTLPAEKEEFEALLNYSNEIFYSRNIEKTEKLLNNYNISYIIIDKKMLDGEIWKKPDEGFLFLMTNEEKFANVYNKGGVRIIYHIK